ncbi:hypothetical protein CEUSTIGMA_g5922.t1 [Chlamydomonas eustigma]|uniref:Uncharacterized protein n=1 Tax=Chlamydomonas eustigma TaxID=1157962 RepID=A0A250X5X6_9CHLO|nr:hypothetical protein CEUSTIGMA_g5922.t1 [Chlamydomonas eustigma]|eukprot:GAX78483.1 hypothetical protein CEUSTIGMA_g5922.t1 [Chlamydomonas eustigma]
MLPKFTIPLRPSDLEAEEIREGHIVVLTENLNNAVSVSLEGAIDSLNSHDPLHINHQTCFDGFYCGIKNFGALPESSRQQLSDALCSNVPFLASSIAHSTLIGRQSLSALQHRNAIQQYVFLLTWLSATADLQFALEAGKDIAKAPTGKSKTSGGERVPAKMSQQRPRKLANKDIDSLSWDWASTREKVLRALVCCLKVDCSILFDGAHEQNRMVEVCVHTAISVLENSTAIKKEGTKLLAFEVLCTVAGFLKRVPLVAESLMSAVRKRGNEHLPEIIGHLAQHADDKYQVPALTVALIHEFVKTEPQGYDQEAKDAHVPSVKHLSELIACLAELQPRVVAANMSLLMPYLACNTYSIRSSIVHMLGAVLAEVFGRQNQDLDVSLATRNDHNQDADYERGQMSRVTTKQHCILVLLERVLDKSAFTRKEVLKAWSVLTESGCVPISLWPKLVHCAHGRLEDGSVMVAKEALRLMQTLLVHAPFGNKLDASSMLASQRDLEDRLKALAGRQNSTSYQDEVEPAADLAGGGAEENWDTQAVDHLLGVEASDTTESAAMDIMDADETAVEAAASSVSGGDVAKSSKQQMTQEEEVMMPSQTQQDGDFGALGNDETTLRTLIATLKTGIHFVRSVLASLPAVRKLLNSGSSSVDVVREAIVLLAMCHQVKLSGGPEIRVASPPEQESSGSQHEAAPLQPPPLLMTEDTVEASLRHMWPLVFSREEGVREAVVDVMYNLYLRDGPGCGPKDHAKELIKLVNGATLGELSSLDEILRLLTATSAAAAPTGSSSDAGMMLPSAGGRASSVAAGSRAYELHKDVVAYIFRYLKNGHEACLNAAAGGSVEQKEYLLKASQLMQNCMVLLSMVAEHAPRLVVSQIPLILQVISSASGRLQDAWTARYCCIALGHLAPVLLPQPGTPGQPSKQGSAAYPASSSAEAEAGATLASSCYSPLCRVMLTRGLGQSTWYSAAEAAVSALYCLHPRPHSVMEGVLRQAAAAAAATASSCFTNPTAFSPLTSMSALMLSRLLFLIGHCALSHLAMVDSMAKRLRRVRMMMDRPGDQDPISNKTAEESSQQGSSTQQQQPAAGSNGGGGGEINNEDIAAQIGLGSQAAEAQLDVLKESIEKEILQAEVGCMLGMYASVVQAVCNSQSIMQAHPLLRTSALLSLTRLMAIDPSFCESNAPLFFTLLEKKELEPSIRCNLVVALGDLAFRFPNVMEPWTAQMYEPLGDPNLDVRRRALGVLSHLILNDMMKVKGHIARIAMCMRPGEDPEIARMARSFFSTLAKKSHRNSNPIYNMLPDILSHLSHESDLTSAQAETVMMTLLDYIKQDKQQDSLREKVCARFELVAEPREWQLLASCIKMLGYSDKGMRRTMEQLKSYKPALGDTLVIRVFEGLVSHARKHGDKKGDLSDLLNEYEVVIREAHEALREEEKQKQAHEAVREEEKQKQAAIQSERGDSCTKVHKQIDEEQLAAGEDPCAQEQLAAGEDPCAQEQLAAGEDPCAQEQPCPQQHGRQKDDQQVYLAGQETAREDLIPEMLPMSADGSTIPESDGARMEVDDPAAQSTESNNSKVPLNTKRVSAAAAAVTALGQAFATVVTIKQEPLDGSPVSPPDGLQKQLQPLSSEHALCQRGRAARNRGKMSSEGPSQQLLPTAGSPTLQVQGAHEDVTRPVPIKVEPRHMEDSHRLQAHDVHVTSHAALHQEQDRHDRGTTRNGKARKKRDASQGLTPVISRRKRHEHQTTESAAAEGDLVFASSGAGGKELLAGRNTQRRQIEQQQLAKDNDGLLSSWGVKPVMAAKSDDGMQRDQTHKALPDEQQHRAGVIQSKERGEGLARLQRLCSDTGFIQGHMHIKEENLEDF